MSNQLEHFRLLESEQNNWSNLNGNLFPISFFSDCKIMPAKVSFNIDLGPDLSNEVMDIARKQGEDPERLSSDIQELRDMIFGKSLKKQTQWYWLKWEVLFWSTNKLAGSS